MEAGRVVVNLDFGKHVHVGFAGQFGGGHFVEGPVKIIGLGGVEKAHATVYTAEFQELTQRLVVDLALVLGVVSVEGQTGALDNLQRRADERRLNFAVGGLRTHGLRRHVVDVWDAIGRHSHFIHCQAFKIADAASQCAIEHEDILGLLEFQRDRRIHHAAQFIGL